MNAGTVEFLLILGGNPVYTAPSDLKFAERWRRSALRAHSGCIEDETAALCHWHVPETHILEMWSDVRADDGTVSIVQPLIAPLYNGKSAHEVVSQRSAQRGARSGYDIVRAYWSGEACGTCAADRSSSSRAAATLAPCLDAPRSRRSTRLAAMAPRRRDSDTALRLRL